MGAQAACDTLQHPVQLGMMELQPSIPPSSSVLHTQLCTRPSCAQGGAHAHMCALLEQLPDVFVGDEILCSHGHFFGLYFMRRAVEASPHLTACRDAPAVVLYNKVVENWGPSWGHFCFWFEFIGF